MKRLLPLLFILSCKHMTPTTHKYYLTIQRSSGSLFTMRKEMETFIDSVYAPDDNAAFDSLMLVIYGQQAAHRLVREAYAKKNRTDEYDAVIGYTIHSAYVYNTRGENVSFFVPDSVKQQVIKKWKVEIDDIDH